jgi:N-acetylglucosaminyl-diphospho-decaprenol L-rhamnosyltransferase
VNEVSTIAAELVTPCPKAKTDGVVAQPLVDVTVLVVNYNTAHLIPQMFDALNEAAQGMRIQIIVIDNASRDRSVQLMRERYPDIALLCNSTNIGFGRANNQGLPLVQGRHVLLLNTDAFLAPESLRKTVGYLDAHPDCGIVGVRLIGRDGALQPSCRYFPTPWNVFVERAGLRRLFPATRLIDDVVWDDRAPAFCDWVPGCFYLVRKTVLDQVGLFDPLFFLYYEEVDHCRRVKAAGWSVAYFPGTSVVHIGGESAKSDGDLTSAGRQISALQIESELLYFRKHHGAAGAWLAVVLGWLSDAWLICKWLLKRRPLSEVHSFGEHARLVWRLFKQTHWATRPTR